MRTAVLILLPPGRDKWLIGWSTLTNGILWTMAKLYRRGMEGLPTFRNGNKVYTNSQNNSIIPSNLETPRTYFHSHDSYLTHSTTHPDSEVDQSSTQSIDPKGILECSWTFNKLILNLPNNFYGVRPSLISDPSTKYPTAIKVGEWPPMTEVQLSDGLTSQLQLKVEVEVGVPFLTHSWPLLRL
jgi:hypothetical protein